jgi:hypothetical protein
LAPPSANQYQIAPIGIGRLKAYLRIAGDFIYLRNEELAQQVVEGLDH